MSQRLHAPNRPPARYTGTAVLGTSLLMPRSPRHNRALAACLWRLPSDRVT
jgi:hypothetical protein